MLDLEVEDARRVGSTLECLCKNVGDESLRVGDLVTPDGNHVLEVVAIERYEGVLVDELEPAFGASVMLAGDSGPAVPLRLHRAP